MRCTSGVLWDCVISMKKNFVYILLVVIIAFAALLISQGLWMRYAVDKNIKDMNESFQECFKKTISETLAYSMSKYNIEYVTDEEYDEVKKKENPVEVNIKKDSEKTLASIKIENALIALSIREDSFKFSKLDTLLTNQLNRDGRVVSSCITLEDISANKILKEIRHDNNAKSTSLYVNTYIAERKIDVSSQSYLIKAEYKIGQSGYLQKLGIVAIVSIIASIVIVLVLFFLLLMINRRCDEISNMERSFHGAIHDLKSPLAYAYFQLLSLEERETDMAKKASLSIAADRVLFLTNKIMRLLKSAHNFRKIEKTDKKEVPLYEMMEQVVVEMRIMFPNKEINFINNIAADFTIRALPDLMEACLRIIVENAIKYNNDNPTVEISAIRSQDDIKITISDNGTGMTGQQMKNIFKPYYSSDKVNGSGIGLYYAQSIAKAHGGRITATSAVGKGSTFLVTLPNSSI